MHATDRRPRRLPYRARAARGGVGHARRAGRRLARREERERAAQRARPVVALTITGAAIGHVDQGHIVIDDPTPNNGAAPEVTPGTGPFWRKDSPVSDTAQIWGGTDFKFRAVGGKYTILIYGSGVDVVVLGTGTVTLTGLVDDPHNDGTYSLNGKAWVSLPGVTTKQLTIGSTPAPSNG